jgi:hypothetical protein
VDQEGVSILSIKSNVLLREKHKVYKMYWNKQDDMTQDELAYLVALCISGRYLTEENYNNMPENVKRHLNFREKEI